MTLGPGLRTALDDAPIEPGQREVLRHRFDAVDAMDIESFLAVHLDNGRLLFGARPPVVGKKDIATQVQAFWRMIGGLRHNILRARASGPLVFVESLIDYERLDGRIVQVGCCDVFKFAGEQISETRAYLDQSEIFAD